MRTLALTSLVLVLALAGSRAWSGDAKPLAPAALSGTYKITAGEHGGKTIPLKELIVDRVTFTDNSVTVVDRDTKKIYAATYKLDGTKTPPRIHMVAIEPKKGEAADGLIRKQGDTVTLIYALPGGPAPTSFKTLAKQLMFTMKKVK